MNKSGVFSVLWTELPSKTIIEIFGRCLGSAEAVLESEIFIPMTNTDINKILVKTLFIFISLPPLKLNLNKVLEETSIKT